jgi:hypothetical protein
MPAYVQTLDGQYVPAAQPLVYSTQLRPVAAAQAIPVGQRTVAPRRTVPRTAARRAAAEERVIVEDARPERTWQKTALIIGGAAASGAGVGAIVDGKKGAVIGAAIGGGAASIYEATRRR